MCLIGIRNWCCNILNCVVIFQNECAFIGWDQVVVHIQLQQKKSGGLSGCKNISLAMIHLILVVAQASPRERWVWLADYLQRVLALCDLYPCCVLQAKAPRDEVGNIPHQPAAVWVKQKPALPRIVQRSGVETQANPHHAGLFARGVGDVSKM